MNLPEPEPISPTAENVTFARAVARAHYGVPLPGEIVAGRELDTLIAEKVMGWSRLTYFERYGRPHHDTAYHRATYTPYWHSTDGKEQAQAEPMADYYHPEDAWSPSMAIGHAWQVVEHLAQMDPPRWLEIGRREHGWSVSVWIHCQAHGDRCEALDRPAWIDDQEIAPLAICRAALAAVTR